MAATSAIITVGFLQIILRTSIFLEQSSDLCSPAPSLASWIFLIAFLIILSDLSIYPVRYEHLPYFCQAIVETVIAILLTEFSVLIVWCTLEKVTYRLTKAMLLYMGMPKLTYNKWESYLLGAVTTIISLLILAYVLQATDQFYVIHKKYKRIKKKITSNLQTFWKYLQRKQQPTIIGDTNYRDYEDGLMCSNNNNKRRRRRRS